MSLKILLVAAAVLAGPAMAAPKVAPPSGDVVLGAPLFAARCAMCHGKDGTGSTMAPSLRGAYGAKAGSSGSPRNSAGMKASSVVWTEPTLDTYLAGPGKMIPGSNMLVAVAKPDDRKNLIAYLATLKK